MKTSGYQLLKLHFLQAVPLAKDAVHIYIGFACLLLALLVLRRPLRSWWALFPGLLVALGMELFESPHSMELGGQRILIVHDIGDVSPRSIEGHAIVIHGFTHREEMKTRGDTLIVNPGEACGWLHGDPSAAILDLDTRQVEFLRLDMGEGTG